MYFSRCFTKKGPYEGIKFVERSSEIRDLSGKLIKSFEKIIVPENWSQTAVDIFAQKYCRKAGVAKILKRIPEEGVPEWLWKSEPDLEAMYGIEEKFGAETDARNVFNRIVGTWTYWGWKYKYFNSESDAKTFYDELCNMVALQKAAPNSPQWFNTGMHWGYGIEGGAQGHYYVDPSTLEIKKSKSAYERPQPHACFIQSVSDDLVNEGGIMDLWVRESRIFKYGSGSGTNFSILRAANESLSSGGVSSGMLSFLKVGDSVAGAIKSGGANRRSAKMVTVDVEHPDIESYVKWKTEEEDKVVFLSVGSKIINEAIKEINLSCDSFDFDKINLDNISDDVSINLDSLNDFCKTYDGNKNDLHLSDANLSDENIESDDEKSNQENNIRKLKFNPKVNKRLGKALRKAEKTGVPFGYLDRILKLLEQGVENVSAKILTTEFESEAYASVSGQNSNNSVRVTNDFMRKVENDEDFDLVYRTSRGIAKTCKARSIWSEISKSAWLCADPGLQYDTTINEWHTCPQSGRINASNPCSEYMFLDDTACNLASINLLKFYKHNEGKWSFESDEFSYAVRIWTLVLEISITMAQYPSKIIAEKSFDFRTLGLGYANLGALMMQSGIPYDSEEGRALAAYVTAIMHGESYKTSAEIAKELGAFAKYDKNKDSMMRVIKNHRAALYGHGYEDIEINPISLDWDKCPIKEKKKVLDLWDEVIDLGNKYGFRNSQVTLLAPTGTIGLLMDCDTLGIEPDFALVKHKKLSGGGYFKIINNSIKPALKSLDYSDSDINKIMNYIIGCSSLEDSPYINHKTLTEKGFDKSDIGKLEKALANSFSISQACSKWTMGDDFCKRLGIEGNNILAELGFSDEEMGACSEYACGTSSIVGCPYMKESDLAVFDCATHGERFVSWEGHVKMIASVQPFLSGAVSKTINMPNNANISDCAEAYSLAWKIGVKAIALYRDGSKLSQALNLTGSSSTYLDDEELSNEEDTLKSVTNEEKDTKLERGYKEKIPYKRNGYTQKINISGGYSFYHTTGENEKGELREIFTSGMGTEGASFRSLMSCFSKAISIGLQYGVPLKEFVSAFKFTKFEPSGIINGHDEINFADSLIDYIFRDLESRYGKNNVSKDFQHNVSLKSNDASAFKGNGSINVNNSQSKPQKSNNLNQSDIKNKNDLSGDEKGSGFDAKQTVNKAEQTKLGYTGDMCAHCKEFSMRRVGTCLQCDKCGSTSGCS
ncbi:adenosylcobalamin-dependent ribonucleoside-diphosphate reductase [Candidatus Nesciobacter abundans]|uniref:Vitamin B12-dependent ribonucleotide reductase n=1 Tax=Candidatus Nesciobacter abundans TaxID=2601668 RepID=A0A5C0UJJ8_9PROT|nr:adenosylcobalamin-dependent ribonucleoside-diphosphate reductase [Candidatus Nesciobacter abundans]QEK38984.1 adenosylcobalamin-dependent ribonucleoside-diphosphate reductase [Candidatus Nesciobacter abundans]